jgi:hypothetical protein
MDDAAAFAGAVVGVASMKWLITLSCEERLNEVAAILAAGLSRLHVTQSSALPADFGDSSLDCAADQSAHGNALDGGMK